MVARRPKGAGRPVTRCGKLHPPVAARAARAAARRRLVLASPQIAVERRLPATAQRPAPVGQ